MTCYTIFTLYPVNENNRMNIMNHRMFQNLIRIHRATLLTNGIMNRYQVSEVVVCDADAASFIRDLPDPFFIAAIVIRANKELFYTNPLLKTEKRPYPPRRDPVEKDVYWWAASCEKRMPRGMPRILI